MAAEICKKYGFKNALEGFPFEFFDELGIGWGFDPLTVAQYRESIKEYKHQLMFDSWYTTIIQYQTTMDFLGGVGPVCITLVSTP